MQLGYILFDGITALDFFGVYDPVSRLKSMQYIPDLEWHVLSQKSQISDSFGLTLSTLNQPDLSGFDVIIVPGGFGTRDLLGDPDFIDWLKSARNVNVKASVCTGSLLLGAAGFLTGKMATTHFASYELLKPFCREVVEARIVHHDNVITAGAVAASMDLGLYLCEILAGSPAREEIQKMMNYRDYTADIRIFRG